MAMSKRYFDPEKPNFLESIIMLLLISCHQAYRVLAAIVWINVSKMPQVHWCTRDSSFDIILRASPRLVWYRLDWQTTGKTAPAIV